MICIACYFGLLYSQAINVPFGDDIFDVLQVISGIVQAKDNDSIFQILFAQHNEHRTLTSRSLYYVTYLVAGEIDFRTLTLLSNLALPLLLVLFYLAVKPHPLRYLVLLSAALILFQLRAHRIMLWPMAAFAYYWVFLYGFSCLHFLHRVNTKKLCLAFVMATLATFSLASGQLIWVLGFLSLLQQSLIRKSISRWYPLAWLACATVVLLAWHWGMETPNRPVTLVENFVNSPGRHILYTLTLLGNAVTEKSVAVAALAGAAMLIIVTVSTVLCYKKEDLRLELLCWFVVFSVTMIALGRSYTTVDYALSSRYSFPSVLMLATTFVLLPLRLEIRSKTILMLSVLLAGVYCINSYRIDSRELRLHLEKRVEYYNQGKFWVWPYPVAETNAIVAKAVSLEIYDPPPRPLRAPDFKIL